jgi:hypothetical protein
VTLLVIGERQTLREADELLVRVAYPRGRALLGGEPFVAAAYLMAIEAGLKHCSIPARFVS